MAEAQRDKIFERLSHVDFLCGPADLDRIPDIIQNIRKNRKHLAALEGYKSGRIPEFPLDSSGAKEVYVKIMEGCDNFCSYCIVPYVRGRERSRTSEDILGEITSIIEQGAARITLLGQNVNSYGKGLAEDIDFPRLLRKIDSFIKRDFPGAYNNIKISFVTSHPKDAGRGLFRAMADCAVIDKTLHMPLQSGSDRILEKMNRGYTLSHYKELVRQYRDIVKGGSILSDFIVGFPGEKEEDFNATLKVMEEIQFDAAYIFKYSPRPFTGASKLTDDIPQDEKERRHRILLETQKKISLEKKLKV
jgi:tRNA-2-methylthio-N6-dimethylallyladenosine synthase